MPAVSQDDVVRIKHEVCRRIDSAASPLIDVSRRIWENPETAFEEHHASAWLTEILEDAGYEVKRAAGGFPTAFTARQAGAAPGPTVGLFSEYDALPSLGHGCGHNLLAISAVGAGVGLAPVCKNLPGAIQIHGTPAEEGPSGKTLLLRNGVFDRLDVAIIFHPASQANVLERMRTGQGINFTFTGKSAHAAAHPDLAIDALNGVLALFNNVNLMRQHFKPDVSVTGSIPDGGGRRAFPVKATARFGVRVFEGESNFAATRDLIVDCARGAALATRTQLQIEYGILERGMKLNEVVTALAVENARDLDIELGTRISMGGMSDFGNVSYKVPATHFSTATWPTGVTAHTPEAVAASCRPQAFRAALDAAKIEAMTAVDILARPEIAQRAWREFQENDPGVIAETPESK